MTKPINLQLYQGNGVPIGKRNQDLPPYDTLAGPEDPTNYIASEGLVKAVNVALALGQPLLITGEPGTGKTRLADGIAHELGSLPLLPFFTKTTSTASDLFYQYDALRRFQDAQLGEKRRIDFYINYQAFGKAILLTLPAGEADLYLPEDLKGRGPTRSVVLIDEIDKAPRDLPNDILNEIEEMEFTVRETGKTFRSEEQYRPILVLTSNSEKNLPDAFLRRCVFFHIEFPGKEMLRKIIQKRFSSDPRYTPGFSIEFVEAAINHFHGIRGLSLKKKPATAEFLAWISILKSMGADLVHPHGSLEAIELSYSILAKNRDDLKVMRNYLAKLHLKPAVFGDAGS